MSHSLRLPEAFRDYFAQFGDLDCGCIMRDKTGQSRGFGFVTYRTKAGAEAVLGNTALLLDGRKVRECIHLWHDFNVWRTDVLILLCVCFAVHGFQQVLTCLPLLEQTRLAFLFVFVCVYLPLRVICQLDAHVAVPKQAPTPPGAPQMPDRSAELRVKKIFVGGLAPDHTEGH